jgi:hypothetical protein
MQTQWGFDKLTWTQGAVYADLDNDGDLDLVLNNQNDIAHIYQSLASDKKINH